MLDGTKLTDFRRLDVDFQPYALAFSSIFNKNVHMAVGSFERAGPNSIALYQLHDSEFCHVTSFPCQFPQTRICFRPHGTLTPCDSFASIDVDLHLFHIEGDVASTGETLSIGDRHPLTCLDWCRNDPKVAVAGCLDGTASIVDMASLQVTSTIQAHETDLYDVSFFPVSSTFVTTGIDGSLRVFDMRDLNSSLIIYQAATPIQRVITSPFEGYLIGAMPASSNRVVIVDSRYPGPASAICGGNETPVTAFGWSKLSPARVYTAHENGLIYSCDIGTYGTVDQEAAHSSASIQNFAVGPMILAVCTDKSVEFVDAVESPPPLACLRPDSA